MQSKLQYGAYQAVQNCVKLKKNEKTVIITDLETKFIADEIFKNCELISPGNTQIFVMEDYGTRSKDGSNPLPFPAQIKKALQNAGVSFYCATCKKGELDSFRTPMLAIVEQNKKIRHAHMPNITKLLMETGMNVDYRQVQILSKKVFDLVKDASQITVTTPAGSNFTAFFEPAWKWVICDALITPDNWSNLPDGEVFTCVKNIPEGKIIVDGVLGDFFCEKYGILNNNPLTIMLKDSRIIDTSCDNKQLLTEFREYIQQDENANRVGEFAIGTNIGLTKLVGNLLQDEKFPGVHVAFGHGYPEKTGSNWHSKTHVDAVLVNCTVNVNGKIIMQDGKFAI